jgi:uncharacterized protein (DUF885 family)
MGTIFQFRNTRIVIRTRDHNPPHVHVFHGDCSAKIEIETQIVVESIGFSRSDMRRIVAFLKEREDLLLEAWNEIHKEENQ